MIQNDSLKKALIEYAEEYFSRYDIPDDEEPHRFSLAYRLRRKNIERLAGKKGKSSFLCRSDKSNAEAKAFMPLKKLAVTMSVVVSAVLLTAAAGAVYFGARGFLFDVHNTHSNVSVDFSVYDIKDTIEEVYLLPKGCGYEMVNEINDDFIRITEYESDEKKLVLSQYSKTFASDLMANTENSVIEEVEVNDGMGYILSHQGDKAESTVEICWVYDEYVFEIIGNIDKDELIRLAESIRC